MAGAGNGRGGSVDYGEVDWLIWRIVVAKMATLEEIDTHWTVDDLMDAHDALDIEMELLERSKKK